MTLTLAYALQSSGLLELFADNRDYDNWEDTALNWVIAALVVSVVCAGLMLAYKWFRKKSARVIREQAWSRGETILLMAVGLFPALLLTIGLWLYSRDFGNVIGVGGLVKGIAFAWLLYLVLMIVAHLASPWRREL